MLQLRLNDKYHIISIHILNHFSWEISVVKQKLLDEVPELSLGIGAIWRKINKKKKYLQSSLKPDSVY